MHVRNILAILLLMMFGWVSSGAQSVPSATREDHQLWAGAEVSLFNPDYVCDSNFPFSCSNDMIGVGAVATYNVRPRLSATAEARWLEWGGANGVIESTYLLGPEYRFWIHGSMALSANVLLGAGRFSNPVVVGSYFVYAPGVEWEKRISPRLKLFAGYQYQAWPAWASAPTTSSTGKVTMHNNGINPNGFSVGVKYRAF
jgi:hypothetical protein